jgi:MFS family permease
MAVVRFGKNRSGKKSVIGTIILLVITLVFVFGLAHLERRMMIYTSLIAISLGIVCLFVTHYIKKNKSEEAEEKYVTKEEQGDRKKKEVIFEPIDYVGLGLCIGPFIVLLRSAYGYTFLSGGFLPFWEISLILGAIVGVIAFLWLRRAIQKTMQKISTLRRTKQEILLELAMQLVFAVLPFILSTFVFSFIITHLNYALDYSEPEEYRAIIEDKDYTRRRKDADSYEFTVTVDGKQYDIDVPSSVYNSYDVGDRFNFKKYKGFFGKEFFMFD